MRKTQFKVLNLAKERWSPRAFSNEKIKIEEIYAVIEAATLAPSCFNEQPWRFIVLYEDDQVDKMKEFLVEKNKLWNKSVRSYILILSKNNFEYNGKENKWAQFDTGTAWGYLSLEAHRRGLITHAMAGFARKAVFQYLNIHEEYTLIALVAIGKYGNIEMLDELFVDDELPNSRLSYKKIIINNKFED